MAATNPKQNQNHTQHFSVTDRPEQAAALFATHPTAEDPSTKYLILGRVWQRLKVSQYLDISSLLKRNAMLTM